MVRVRQIVQHGRHIKLQKLFNTGNYPLKPRTLRHFANTYVSRQTNRKLPENISTEADK